MRKIKTEEIIGNLREMCMEANYSLSGDMKKALEDACRKEVSPLGCRILGQLQENMKRLLDEANKTNESEEKI